jgi:hypothetical protein
VRQGLGPSERVLASLHAPFAPALGRQPGAAPALLLGGTVLLLSRTTASAIWLASCCAAAAAAAGECTDGVLLLPLLENVT